MENKQGKVLTVAECAQELRISVRLAYKQIKAGTIPAVKVGDRYLIPVKAFEAWLSCNRPIASEASGAKVS